MTVSLSHEPVMVREVLQCLSLKPGDVVIDGTLGLAGHALEFCKLIAPGGTLIGLDWDQSMLAEARERLSAIEGVDRYIFHADYRSIPDCLQEVSRQRPGVAQAQAIFLDLGLNNAQITDASRGISFVGEGPLDMRMDRSKGEPASSLLNRWSEREIEKVLWTFGDERWAKRIAQVILEQRKHQAITTTQHLVDCVMKAIPASKREKHKHPATRTFQAIRIAVNGELDGLEDAISSAARCLAPGGVMTVLAYHSGEDRAAKLAFKQLTDEGFDLVTKKPLSPSQEEIARNHKSRSAKLRALRRSSELESES